MKIEKKKRIMESLIKKLQRAKDFGSACNLDTDEARVAHELLTETAVRIARIQNND